MSTGHAVRFLNPAGLPPTRGYSHVAEVTGGKLLLLAGQLPLDAAGQVVGKGDFKAQVTQTFHNLATALEGAGGSLHHLVRLVYYIHQSVQMPDLVVMGQVRDGLVNRDAPPASAVVFVPRFVGPDVLFEIEATAAIP